MAHWNCWKALEIRSFLYHIPSIGVKVTPYLADSKSPLTRFQVCRDNGFGRDSTIPAICRFY